MELRYEISGMHCGSCVTKLTETLQNVDGVESAIVTLDPPEARVEGAEFDSRRVTDAVEATGDYQAKEITSESPQSKARSESPSAATTYYPLILIVVFLLVGSTIIQVRNGSWSWMHFMSDFMGGFFVVFGFFKLLDLQGFADAYQSYDLIAAKSRSYGYVYPFMEVGLGVAYLIRFAPFWTNVITLIVMVIGSAGVLRSLFRRQRIQCACLGTVFDLPMSTVTLVEDAGMAVMAGLMFLWM